MEQAAALQASSIGQMEVSKWMDMFDLNTHVSKIKDAYRRRRTCMVDALAGALPESCGFTRPNGGLFTWVTLPISMDAKKLQRACIENGVAFVPGGGFFPNGGHENTMRLNYSCMPEDQIVRGVHILAETIREIPA